MKRLAHSAGENRGAVPIAPARAELRDTGRPAEPAQGYPARAANRFNIGLLHTTATRRPGHASYAPCTVEQLAPYGFDYWARLAMDCEGAADEEAVLARCP